MKGHIRQSVGIEIESIGDCHKIGEYTNDKGNRVDIISEGEAVGSRLNYYDDLALFV